MSKFNQNSGIIFQLKKCMLFFQILIILFINFLKTDATSSLNIHVGWYKIGKTYLHNLYCYDKPVCII
jgi:hypothetical protein